VVVDGSFFLEGPLFFYLAWRDSEGHGMDLEVVEQPCFVHLLISFHVGQVEDR
jgi:hypothetical protein